MGLIGKFVYTAIALALFGVLVTCCCFAKKRKWQFNFRDNNAASNAPVPGVNYNAGSNIPPCQVPNVPPPSNPYFQYPHVNPDNSYPQPTPGLHNAGYQDPPPPYSQVVNGKPAYGFNVGSS